MKHPRLSLRLAFGLCAGLASLGLAHAQIPESVSLSDVYGLEFPATVTDLSTGINAANQARSLAVNNNPDSPWKGTLYVTRRNVATGAAAGPAGIFYWKAVDPNDPSRGTLKAAGPDLSQADGYFTPPEGFTTHGNAWWGIAVSDDDLVYATSLNSGQLFRFNADLTDPVLVSTELTTTFIRHLEAYGKGINTEIWFNYGSGTTSGGIVRMKATAVDDQNRPTAFAKEPVIPLTFGGSLYAQGQINNARDTYYTAFFPVAGQKHGPAKIAYPSGVRDTNYPAYEVHNSTGLQIDSMDRVVYSIGYSSLTDASIVSNFVALHPETGADLSSPAKFRPSILVPGSTGTYGNHLQIARYSDRHYFFTAAGVNGVPPNAMGVVATDLPAPAPKNIRVKNLGTGNSLQLSWTPANDPEVTGVFIYRSQTAGQLGTALNTTLNAGTTFTDTNLTANTQYYYTLISQGLDPFQNTTYEGVPSVQVLGVPAVLQVPAAPTGVSITDTKQGGELRVTWTTPTAFAETINIYRSETAGTLGTLIHEIIDPAAGAEGSYLDRHLTNGKTYYYTVRAANVVGESSNTQQFSGVPTDIVAPTFNGLKAAQDLGFPGVRLTWDSAVDQNGFIAYNVYTGPSMAQINYSTPVGSVTNQTFFDLSIPTLGQETVVAVRAEDSSGNEDANTKALIVMPTRVIVDPDLGGGVNNANFNPQPDPAVPALGPEGPGGSKGNAPDLTPPNFAVGAYFFQTNDKLGKSSYTLNIPVAGNYDISAWWTAKTELDTPNYTFRITYPNGTTENVVVDMKGGPAAEGGNGARWNLLVNNKDLTPGTLTIVGDATTSTNNDPLKINVSSAIRALLNVTPEQVTIYTATTAPTIDGNITDAAWGGANVITLGKAIQDVVGGKWSGPADWSANYRLLWNNDGLFIAGRVWDDVLSFKDGAPDVSHSFWDSLELYLGMEPTADPARTTYLVPGDYQVLITGYHEGGGLKGIMAEGGNRMAFPTEFGTHEVAFSTAPGGYTFEAFLPWSYMVGVVAPQQNQVIGFNLQGIDNDTVTTLAQESAFSLSTKGSSWQNPQNWIKALLAGTAPARPRGDINLDGVFNNADVTEALRVTGGLASVSAEARQAADVTGDGKIAIDDVTRMQKALIEGVAP